MIFHMTSIVAIQLPGRRQIDIARSHKFRGQPIAHFKFPWWLWYDWLVQPWIKLFNKSVLTLDALALEHIELPTSFKGLESVEVLLVEGKAKCRAKRPTLSSCHEYSTRNTTSWPLPTFGRTLCSVHGLRALLLFDASEKVPSEVDNKSIETEIPPTFHFAHINSCLLLRFYRKAFITTRANDTSFFFIAIRRNICQVGFL